MLQDLDLKGIFFNSIIVVFLLILIDSLARINVYLSCVASFALIVFNGTKNIDKGILLHMLFVSPSDRLFLHNQIQGNISSYRTLLDLNIAGVSLPFLLFLLFAIINFLHNKKFALASSKVAALHFALLLCGVLGYLFNLGDAYSALVVFQKLYFFLFIFLMGYFVVTSFKNRRDTINFLFLIVFVGALRGILFLLVDIYYNRFPPNSLFEVGYLLPIYFYLQYLKPSLKSFALPMSLIIVLLSIFQTGRGGIIVLIIVLASRIVYINKYKLLPIFILIVLFTVVLYVYVLPIYFSEYFRVISFKLNLISELNNGELSHSPKVRLIEFKSIWDSFLKEPIKFVFGFGIGGYLDNLNLGNLSQHDYSLAEIASSKFYQVHSFVNYILLNFGFVGLLFYISTPFIIGKRPLLSRSERMLVSMSAFPIIYSMFWRLDFVIVAFLIERILNFKE